MKKRGTYYVSTFTVDESAFVLADHPAMLDDPFLAGALSPNLCNSSAVLNIATRSSRIRTCRSSGRRWRTGCGISRRYTAPGVRIAFGTDSGANPARIPGWPSTGVGADGGGRPQADGRPCRRDTRERRDARSDRIGERSSRESGQTSWCCRPTPGRRPEHEAAVSVWHGGREIQPAVTSANAR